MRHENLLLYIHIKNKIFPIIVEKEKIINIKI